MMTAMMTSTMMATSTSRPESMRDAKVGVVHGHLYESLQVANQGGVIIDVHGGNITQGIHLMIEMLKSHQIDGFALDKYEMMLFYHHFQKHTTHTQDKEFIKHYTIMQEIAITDDYYYGVLVKNQDDYDFLEDFVSSNRDVINSCNALFLSKYSRQMRISFEEPHSLLAEKGDFFWPMFTSCAIVVTLIMIGGWLYEWRRRWCKRNQNGALNLLHDKSFTEVCLK